LRKLTASNIVATINQLDKNVAYNYINTKNAGLIKVVGVQLPEGPIKIKRWNPRKGEREIDQAEESISTEMIWRIANAYSPYQPINRERVLGASYNTRSVLEALLAHTPEFCYCYPKRLDNFGAKAVLKKGHKHSIWTPDDPHQLGILKEFQTDIVVSEVAINDAYYEQLSIQDEHGDDTFDIDIKRRHAQIQVALYFIGKQLGYRTWIAQNDKSIIYNNQRIIEYDGVVKSLQNEQVIATYSEAIKAALLIDCIWFRNGRFVPAVMEVEHSTGVTSGLTRMKNFQDKFIDLRDMRFVIVAPDEDKEKVIQECNKEQFKSLDARYFPYSSVEELYALCKKRKLKGVNQEFLDCYMEPTLYGTS